MARAEEVEQVFDAISYCKVSAYRLTPASIPAACVHS